MRAVEDDHVDRPGVEAQQCVQLTGTNSSIGLIALINQRPSQDNDPKTISCFEPVQKNRLSVCLSPAWWLLRSGQTRSHPELGRQTLQRQWYYVSRPGRVGRRQACQRHAFLLTISNTFRRLPRPPVRVPVTKPSGAFRNKHADIPITLTRGGAAR